MLDHVSRIATNSVEALPRGARLDRKTVYTRLCLSISISAIATVVVLVFAACEETIDPPPPPPPVDYYASIAADNYDGNCIAGVSWRQASESQSEASAIAACRARGGRQCIQSLTFENSGAIAYNGSCDYWTMNSAHSKSAAEAAALSQCREGHNGCRIIASISANDPLSYNPYRQGPTEPTASTSLLLSAKPIEMMPPAGLRLKFSVRLSNGFALPTDLTSSDIEVINDEKGTPFGGPEGGAVSNPDLPSDFHLLTVLILDFSDSIFQNGVQSQIKSGVEEYLKNLLEPQVGDDAKKTRIKENHEIAIVQLGSTKDVKLVLDFTDNVNQIKSQVSKMIDAGGLGSTDLYGAYIRALNIAASHQVPRKDLVGRSVVLFTDGTHQAGDERRQEANALSAKERYQNILDIFAIGLAGEYNEEKLRDLASHPTAPYFSQAGSGQVVSAFTAIAQNIDKLSRSNYVVRICTPVTLGRPTVTLKAEQTIGGVKYKGETRVSYDPGRGNLTGEVSSCKRNFLPE